MECHGLKPQHEILDLDSLESGGGQAQPYTMRFKTYTMRFKPHFKRNLSLSIGITGYLEALKLSSSSK